MQEVVDTEEEVLVYSHEAVVFHLKAQGCKCGVSPEIEAAGNFHVASAGSLVYTVAVFLIVIVIDEEEGVAPIVTVESFQSCGEMVSSKIVEGLKVGLCTGYLGQGECCCSSCDDFFHKA